jgi:tetratricopeptide (TPR) repeat protein
MVAAMALAGIVGWVGYARTSQALEAEARQLRAAKEATAEAERAKAEVLLASEKLEANLRMSLEAFEAVFEAAGGISNQPWLPGRGFGGFVPVGIPMGGVPVGGRPVSLPGEDERAAVLEAILTFYDRFAEQNATNPKLQLDAGRAHRRVGEVHVLRGNSEKAVVAFRRAASLLEQLTRDYPNDPTVKAELIHVYLGAPPDAFADYERLLLGSRDMLVELSEPQQRQLLGPLTLKLGKLRDRAGDRAGAERAYREAIPALGPPGDVMEFRPPSVSIEQATARMLLAALLADTNRGWEARKVLEETAADLRRFTERQRGMGRPPWELIAVVQQQLADVCERLGDRAAGEAARAEANRALGQSHAGFGGNPGGPDRPGPKGPPNNPRKN